MDINKQSEQGELDKLVKETLRDGFKSVPNIMSIFRILLIPAIILLYLNDYSIAAVSLIVISALTDLLDGVVARRFNMVTDLGKALDPIADKLTLGAIMISLAVKNLEFLTIVLFMVIKETLGFIMHWIIFKNGGGMHGARWYGKLSTWLLYITVGAVMMFDNLPGAILKILIIACIVSISFAMAMYTLRCRKILLQRKNDDADRAQQQ